MPWHAAKSEQCPMSRPWAVIKDADGEVEGCHMTEADANDQVAALYASETRSKADEYLAGLPELKEYTHG